MIENLFLCNRCIKDTKLMLYFSTQPQMKEKCSFCNEIDQTCLDVSYNNSSFNNFLTALIRYYYSEDLYNRHWGGENIESFFLEENDIFNYDMMKDNKEIDYVIEALGCMLGEHYMYDKDGVCLYYGDVDGTRGCYFESIKDTYNHYLRKVESKLLKENYFLFEGDVKDKLTNYKKDFKDVLLKSSTFFRARIGYETKVKVDAFLQPCINYIPYSKDQISAPATKLVTAGRLNRQGVSFLYLATNIDTAINEVRPDPGHKVSIGKFNAIKDLSIVDFDRAFINMSDTEKSLKNFEFLNHIDQLFSRPITQDERHKYIITQFFADIFRKLGFDGVKFTSSVGSGKNLLIFNPKDFEYIDSEENKVYNVLKLRYTTKAL